MNPASRLLEFVHKAQSLPGNLSAIEGWVSVLDLENDNYIEIYTGIANIIRLVHDTRRAISGLDGYKQELFLGPVNNVLSAIAVVNLQATWEPVKSKFDSLTMQGLEFCSTVLDQHSRDTSLSDDKIKTWLQEIESLLNSVTTSELPDQLKIFFVEHLEKLRYALRHYWIFGSGGVQSSVERTVGALYFRIPQNPAINDNSIFQRLMTLLADVASAITVVEGAQALGGVVKFLLSGAS